MKGRISTEERLHWPAGAWITDKHPAERDDFAGRSIPKPRACRDVQFALFLAIPRRSDNADPARHGIFGKGLELGERLALGGWPATRVRSSSWRWPIKVGVEAQAADDGASVPYGVQQIKKRKAAVAHEDNAAVRQPTADLENALPCPVCQELVRFSPSAVVSRHVRSPRRVDGLDLSAMSGSYRGSGSASYHPALRLGLLVYGYATGVFSSHKIERATYDSAAFRFIAANEHPDHDTIATFRRRFIKDIEGLFVQVLALALERGMLKLGTVGLDGTKIHANASRHRRCPMSVPARWRRS